MTINIIQDNYLYNLYHINVAIRHQQPTQYAMSTTLDKTDTYQYKTSVVSRKVVQVSFINGF